MDEFVPFFDLPIAQNADLKLNEGNAHQEFHAMIPTPTSLAPSTSSSSQTPLGSSTSHLTHPLVKLIREGDKIKQIRIQCTCGQVIELDCVY